MFVLTAVGLDLFLKQYLGHLGILSSFKLFEMMLIKILNPYQV